MLNEGKDIGLLKLGHYPQTNFPPQICRYRALTQLCRRVRQEFLPLWQQRHIYAEISLCDTARFVDTFYDLEDPRVVAAANGSLEISLDREARLGDPNEVDLLPLLRLLIKAPRLHSQSVAIRYIRDDGMPDYIRDFVTLLRLPKVEKEELRNHFLYLIEKLILTPLPSPDAPFPQLKIRPNMYTLKHDLHSLDTFFAQYGFAQLKTTISIMGDEETEIELSKKEDYSVNTMEDTRDTLIPVSSDNDTHDVFKEADNIFGNAGGVT